MKLDFAVEYNSEDGQYLFNNLDYVNWKEFEDSIKSCIEISTSTHLQNFKLLPPSNKIDICCPELIGCVFDLDNVNIELPAYYPELEDKQNKWIALDVDKIVSEIKYWVLDLNMIINQVNYLKEKLPKAKIVYSFNTHQTNKEHQTLGDIMNTDRNFKYKHIKVSLNN